MDNQKQKLMPITEEYIKTLGENIRLARRRRKLSSSIIAERSGISRQTLYKIEKGFPNVSMGSYASVLHALNGLDKELENIAREDIFGRQLQDNLL